jgi:PAS domain S-box-containing protein
MPKSPEHTRALSQGRSFSDNAGMDLARAQAISSLTHSAFGSIVDTLADAVTIRGPGDELIYANQAALDRLGLESIEALRAIGPRELMGAWEVVDEHGQELQMEDLPSVRLLRGEDPEPLLLRSVHRGSGEEQWALLKTSAVRDSSDDLLAAVTIIEDVTDSQRAKLRNEFLAQISQLLASSLDYEQTLRNVAGLAVPTLADWCAMDLFSGGKRQSVAIVHSDPDKLEMAARLRAFEGEDLDDQGLGRVARTGEPLLFSEVPDELLTAAAVNGEHLQLLRQVGFRSVLVVPMTAGARTIGALTMVSADSGRRFDRGDLEFAEDIAARSGLAVENARLYSERSEIARTLQHSLLPEALPEIPGWEISTLYRPAGHGSEVGGDFYDFWEAGEDWLMMIGDVTGKGVGAAALTSLVRHTARTASEFDPRPAQILGRVDRELKRRPALSLCTALCLGIRGETLTIAAGGHPLPLLISDQEVAEVGRHGTLLGGFPRVRWPENQFTLASGDTLVAITDGVTDTVGAGGERFGDERLHAALDAVRGRSPREICAQLLTALEDFQVGEQADDTAIVVMRHAGTSARPAAAGRPASASASGAQGGAGRGGRRGGAEAHRGRGRTAARGPGAARTM